MEVRMSLGLKYTFLGHAIIATFFGLVYLFIPETWNELIKWPMEEIDAYRLLGAAILGYGTSSWLAYRATTKEAVLIIVRMELVWTALGAIVLLFGVLSDRLPNFAWVNIIIFAAFAVLFSVFYPRR